MQHGTCWKKYEASAKDSVKTRTDEILAIRSDKILDSHADKTLFALKKKGEFREKILFTRTFAEYESKLGVKWSDQKMEWDYLNSVLFAGTLCTTIGKL